MTAIADPIQAGLDRGWRVVGRDSAADDMTGRTFECDVAIVGTGAGGGVTAELLTRAGLSVVLVEEGPLAGSTQFAGQRESYSYPALYQESAARKTADKAITILQGRCVGGSTTVNWTSSFRTPAETLTFWRDRLGLSSYTEAELEPWFEAAERRLSIAPWVPRPNRNNDILRQGAQKLGLPVATIARNVKGCWNLGSCGLGCPTNAKQSMLVTCIPAALDRGALLMTNARAEKFRHADGRIKELSVVAVGPGGVPRPAVSPARVIARHYVVAGGSINSPGLMLRSDLPDPYLQTGKRTFLHPVVIGAALFGDPVEAWAGAPQAIYTDAFLPVDRIDGAVGYKLEAAPMHPVILATTVCGFGSALADVLRQYPFAHALIALMRDGFHPESTGGTVSLRSDGTPVLDYPLRPIILNAARRAYLSMAELQFAAGARSVLPIHEDARPYHSWVEARTAITSFDMRPLRTRVVSAHVMGGCAMAPDERRGVVRPDGLHWHVENLSVHDGSLFPTSVGANPQLSIYGIVGRMAAGLGQRLSGREVRLA